MFYRLTIFLYSSIFMIRFCVFCVFRCPAPKWGFFLIARLMTSSNASVSSISDWSRRSVDSRLSVQSGFTAVKPILSSPIDSRHFVAFSPLWSIVPGYRLFSLLPISLFANFVCPFSLSHRRFLFRVRLDDAHRCRCRCRYRFLAGLFGYKNFWKFLVLRVVAEIFTRKSIEFSLLSPFPHLPSPTPLSPSLSPLSPFLFFHSVDIFQRFFFLLKYYSIRFLIFLFLTKLKSMFLGRKTKY